MQALFFLLFYSRLILQPIDPQILNVLSSRPEKTSALRDGSRVVGVPGGIWNERHVALLGDARPSSDTQDRLAGERASAIREGATNPGHLCASQLPLLESQHRRTRHSHGSLTKQSRRPFAYS